MPQFDALKIHSCGKHCEKKEKLLVTSNFSFSHNVFYSVRYLFIILNSLLPITRQQILDSSKLKEFADDNLKFDKNGRKLSRWVENTVGKGKIALDEQFLLFPKCFQKACLPGASKGVIVLEWVKMLSAICFNLDQSKILLSGNGLNVGISTTPIIRT